MKHAWMLLSLVALPMLAQAQSPAQTVWRCGPDGRTFSDSPCAEGRSLYVGDTRPAEDVAAARALADREMRLADQLRRERLREEAAQRGNGLAALGPVSNDAGVNPPRRALRQPPRAKPALRRPATSANETSRAVAPASRRGQG